MNEQRPVIALLTAADEAYPPGLDAVEPYAEIRHVRDREGLMAALPEADILLVTDFRTAIVRDAWPYAQRLQWVHATSAGVDALLFPEMIASDIPVTNARGIFDRSIAEYVLGLILLFAKDFRRTLRLQDRRQWQHRETERAQGRRALVVGAGSIGRQIGTLLRCAGLHAEGVASRPRDGDEAFDRVIGADGLQDALPAADFVVIAAPLTEATRGLFDRQAFRVMAPHARLVNIGRGPIVVTDDLVAALEAGEIAGAALDVFEEEPLPPDHPLWTFENVFISHHMAGDFIGWKTALSEQFAEHFHAWRNGRPLPNTVDKQRGYVPPS